MTIREILREATARLNSAGVPNADYDAAQMLAHVLCEDALMMRLNNHREIDEPKRAAYEAMLARREAREPMQYILGEAGFMGLTFHVGPGVLCPRPDTEILCEEALRRLPEGAGTLPCAHGHAYSHAGAYPQPGGTEPGPGAGGDQRVYGEEPGCAPG